MDKKVDLRIPVLVVSISILIFLMFGITYAIYRNVLIGTTNNIIKSGVIRFSYDENISETNGIRLVDALPIADSVGMIMNGSNQFFDFSISCTTSLADIDYDIILEKVEENTMPDKYIKVYLTKLYSGNEVSVDSVYDNGIIKTYSEFPKYNDNSVIIHKDTVKKGAVNYIDNYRLRLWIMEGDYDYEQIYYKRFSVKINVKASE